MKKFDEIIEKFGEISSPPIISKISTPEERKNHYDFWMKIANKIVDELFDFTKSTKIKFETKQIAEKIFINLYNKSHKKIKLKNSDFIILALQKQKSKKQIQNFSQSKKKITF